VTLIATTADDLVEHALHRVQQAGSERSRTGLDGRHPPTTQHVAVAFEAGPQDM
jgi:hypothetical protein